MSSAQRPRGRCGRTGAVDGATRWWQLSIFVKNLNDPAVGNSCRIDQQDQTSMHGQVASRPTCLMPSRPLSGSGQTAVNTRCSSAAPKTQQLGWTAVAGCAPIQRPEISSVSTAEDRASCPGLFSGNMTMSQAILVACRWCVCRQAVVCTTIRHVASDEWFRAPKWAMSVGPPLQLQRSTYTF